MYAYVPSLIFVIVYLSDVANAEDLKWVVFSYHKEYFYHIREIWGGE